MKRGNLCQKNGKGRILILLLGFTIGIVFGTWIYKKNNAFVHRFMKCHHNYEVGRRPRTIRKELHPSLLVFVGVLIEIAEIETRARILYNDWAASIPGKIVFFTIKKADISSLYNVSISVVHLEGIQSDSKIEIKYLGMLRYITSHYLGRFKWFMLAQHDSFINMDKLSFLRHLNYLKDFILIPERDQMHEGLPKQTSYLFSPGIIISKTFLQKISIYLAHCFQHSSSIQNGDVHTCFEKSLTIDWSRDQQELNTTGGSKYFPNVCKNIDDKDVTNIVTADLSRDAHCMYRLQVRLLSQKLRINGRNYVKLKNRLDILKELITSDVYQRRTRVRRRKDNSNQYGFIFTINRIFSLKTQLSWRMTKNEKQGIDKVKENVMDRLREAHHSRDENLKFHNLHYGYISINPIKEIEYVLDIYTDTFEWHLATTRQVFGRLEKKIVQTARTLATVNIVVPLAGKLESFKYFMENLEKYILIKKEPVSLLVVYFPEKHSSREHLRTFDTYKTKYPRLVFNWLNLTGEFARANALQAGVRFYKKNSLIFIADIDLTFNSDFLQRCRDHTVYKQRAYFPAMFKYFNPRIGGSRINSSNYFKSFQRQIGFWALHSFGPLCAYSNDIVSVGGFNVQIKQWGFEDIQLFERFLNKNYDIIRTADPGLAHIYHPHTPCDVISNILQRRMCNGAMLNGLASRETLAKYLLAKSHLIL